MTTESSIQGLAPKDHEFQLIGPGSIFTHRHDWGELKGQQKLELPWKVVTARSKVFVAIGEGFPGGPDGGKFIGAARFTLYNVAPRDGVVGIWVNIEWDTPIRLYADYLVVNE